MSSSGTECTRSQPLSRVVGFAAASIKQECDGREETEDDKADRIRRRGTKRTKIAHVFGLLVMASLLFFLWLPLLCHDAPAPIYASVFVSLLLPLPAPLYFP